MKLAIPTKNNQVDNHFGHCDYFTIVTIEDNKIIDSQKLESGNTCGCKSNVVFDLKKQGVETMLAGQMGQGAINKVNEAGIKVVRGCNGDINEVIADFLAGKIQDKMIVCAPHDGENDHQCSH